MPYSTYAHTSMRCLCLLLLCCGFVLPVAAQKATTSDEPLSERRVSYTMDVALDPAARTVSGTQQITWRNPDRVPVAELQFHLYLNAFKPGSTFMKESGGSHRGFIAEGQDVSGGITIERMQLAPRAPGDAGQLGTAAPAIDLTERIQFIQPDDGNTEDQTVISVRLPEAVAPGETITLAVDFTAKMPRIFARTGWEYGASGEPFFMVAQWFPKLGVYEVPGQRYVPADAPQGQWSTHQFHANSEFYADFGTYDVTLSTPAHYRVGASGVQIAEQTEGDTKTVTYRAEDVHDFAWTTSPDFLEFTDTWRHVNLRLLVQPEHAAQADRHFAAAKHALERFDAWVGEYPYTTLTLVDGIGGSNGMEYPTLITCGTVYMLPAWARFLELVTVHEFGHQYFYGLLASNEAEEAWLDEGMNSYLEMRIMDDAYGNALGLPGLEVTDGAFQRLGYTKNNPSRGALFTRSWEYQFSSDYGKNSYAKPATVMMTLERYLGWERMQEVLQTYYQRWRFRHPTTRDFIAVVEEVSGEEMAWFFDQFVYGTAVVDYAVHSLSNQRQDDGSYQATVRVKRNEDGIFPQVLRVTFEDGTFETLAWDGAALWESFTFDQRVVAAYLDPENAVWLDINRLNNRRALPDHSLARKVQLKMLVWLQQAFQLAAGLF